MICPVCGKAADFVRRIQARGVTVREIYYHERSMHGVGGREVQIGIEMAGSI